MPTILFREKEIPNIREFDVYVKNDGYEGLKKALGMKPDEVIEEVKKSNLRGRGGAGFPAGVKWGFIPKDEPVKYVTVNCDESEPGTFKDRQLMEFNPHQVIEGAMICAWATQAKAVYIYMRGEFWDIAPEIDKCIAAAREAGFIGENIQGTGWSCEMYTHLGAGAYICGEESALLNSLEGLLGQPRVRPPFPAQKGGGLYKEATVVNNVETLANVPWILRNGGEEYAKIGIGRSTGTKIFCVSGNVKKPGNYELPMGTTLRELLYDHAGGPPDGREFKGVLPSGASGPILRVTDEVLDTPLTYEHFEEIGSTLGSASVIVMDDSVNIAWAAYKITKFFKHESCGKCTPCREGMYWLDKMLDRIMAGQGAPEDVELIDSIARNLQPLTLCALGEFAANPIIYTISRFPEDFEEYVGKMEVKEKELAAAGD